MDSSALEDSAETNNDAHTGNEYMQKKQRTDASEVTNPWLMGICCWKDMCVGVVRLYTFLTHSRKAPSRVDRVQYTDLAAVLRLFIIKL